MSDTNGLPPQNEDQRWDGYLSPRVWFPAGLLALAAIAFLGVMLVLNWGDGEAASAAPQLGEDGSLRHGVHMHADFALQVRGETYDFSQPQFLSTEEGELSPAVHIHNPRHSVVHVHLSSSTWGEFFQSLGVSLTDSCVTLPDGEQLCNTDDERWTFLVNGVPIDSLRFQYIGDLDRVLLSYGPETQDHLKANWEELVTDEACIPSGICSDRFPPGGIEEEPCSAGSIVCN